MNYMQEKVAEFHKANGLNPPKEVGLHDADFRARLIEEEAKETVDALRSGDIIETIDGLCDLLYVVFGTAATMGIDLEPFFDEVHQTNMLKVGGKRREDGKIIKPENWQPPRIKDLLKILYTDRIK